MTHDDRLDSWKEIAAYLGRGVTTVQRWEHEEGLPVHRLPHAKRGSVFGFKSEIDAWRRARADDAIVAAPKSPEPATDDPPQPRLDRWTLTFGAAAVALAAGALVWSVGRFAVSRTTATSSLVLQRPLATEPERETTPSLSPDGERVVYFWDRKGAEGLYIKPTAGGAAKPLLLADQRILQPAYPKWSPRGDLIAFLTRPEQEDIRSLYVIPSSGGTPRRLVAIEGIGLCWSPDGQSIGFVDRNSSGEPLSIFAIELVTGQRHRLTTPPAGTFGDTHCAFSPDGKRLAVSRYHSRYQSDLYIVDVRGSGSENRLTRDFEGVEGLEWSPDGRELVFGSSGGLWRIRLSAVGSSTPELMTAFGESAAYPTFSRTTDSPARLAYQRKVLDLKLWRWERSRADSVTKITESLGWDDHAALSTDGRQLAFSSNRTGTSELWISAADGSNPKQITFHGGPSVSSPQWSPDGTRLAYSAHLGGNRDIYVVPTDGSKAARLTWEASKEENPSWSRDGRWIYFRSDRSGAGQLWKIAPDGGNAVRVTKGEASQGFESQDGRLLYFVRSMDVPGLWSMPVAGGEETFVVADVREPLWSVAEGGIAFLAVGSDAAAGRTVLRFFDFASRKTTTLATLPGRVTTGFTATRDGGTVIWTRVDSSQSDVILIEPRKLQ